MDQEKLTLKKTRARITIQLAGEELSHVIEFMSVRQPSLNMQRESDEAYAASIASGMVRYDIEILE